MAGIGFELRRIIDSEKGLLHSIKAYGSALITINGPMIMCLVAVMIVKLILGNSYYSGISSDKIIMTITLAFSISTVLTGGYSIVLSRYVSDCIYKKNYSKITPSMYGGIVFASVFSIFFIAALVILTHMKLEHAVPVSILYSIVSIIYIEMIFLSSIRNYKAILRGFFLGNIVLVLFIFFVKYVDKSWAFQYIFFSVNIGFALTAKLLLHQILIAFGKGSGGFMEWTVYLKKYPSLALSGLFYPFSFYFVSFYYRFIDNQGFIQGFMSLKPDFDIAFYFAVLGMIPGMIYFAVRFETSLYTCCQDLFSTIQKNRTLDEIELKLKFLVMTVKRYFIMIALVQGSVLFSMAIAPFAFMHADHTSFTKYILYWEFIFALSASLLMYVSNIVVLYFDARRYSLIINSVYFGLNIVLTFFLDSVVVKIRGFGFMTAAFFSMLFSVMLMLHLLNSLKNYLFIMRNS